MPKERLIKLGLSMDYPIEWSIEEVIRDLIQNFYDEIGEKDFGKRFIYSVSEEDGLTCEMKMSGHSFSYEWLTYIGGSTKTDKPGKYIGLYGEGFKMCMLRLAQMSLTDCCMESRDWKIRPCVYTEKVGTRKVDMLGYKLSSRADNGCTKMLIKGIGRRTRIEKNSLEEILYLFLYPQNPILSKCIGKRKSFAAYERSDMPLPDKSRDPDFKGVLYINNLARARLDIPLVINVKGDFSTSDNRKREVLSRTRGVRIITAASKDIGAALSYKLLLSLRDKWNDLPREKIDIFTWYYFICQLVRNVASVISVSERFTNNFPKLFYIERKGSDHNINRFIDEVSEWIKTTELDKNRIVNPVFRLLGAQSLVKIYEETFLDKYRACSKAEKERLDLLFDAEEMLFSPIYFYDERPLVYIDDSKRAGGMQFVERDYSKVHRKYKIKKIICPASVLHEDEFECAIVRFVEFVSASISKKKSKKRAYVLTDLCERIIRNREQIETYRKGWSNA